MTRLKTLLALCIAAACLVLVACGDSDDASDSGSSDSGSASGGDSTAADAPKLSGQIAGAGASSQEAAMAAWIAGFQQANPDATVSYDPVGSGGGREQFISGGVAFAGSDSALKEDELKGAQDRCGGPDNLVEVPVYISPIALIYNLEGVDNLQLSPSTAAKIFDQKIKKWNDPAIAADNSGVELPDKDIVTVHRSDESGTTENVQQWLAGTAAADWKYEPDNVWPVKGGEAAQGTSGVVDAVKNGDGSIGYADESQAGDLGVAKIKVGETFNAPTPEGAAKVLEESEQKSGTGKNEFAYDLKRDVTTEGAYPLMLVSYQIACTKYDDAAQGKLVAGLQKFILSPEGQEQAGEAAGSAPLSDDLRAKFQPAVDAIGAG